MNFVAINQQLTAAIFSLPHPPPAVIFFQFFSAIGSFAFVWILITLYIIVIEEKRDSRFMVYFLVAIAASSFLINIVLKPLVARPRPLSSINRFTLSDQLIYRFTDPYPNDFSFPSGHAAVAFAAATILSAFDKKRRGFFYIIASLIAFSRVYLGYHYLFDVIGGILVGLFVSKVILIIHGKYAKRR